MYTLKRKLKLLTIPKNTLKRGKNMILKIVNDNKNQNKMFKTCYNVSYYYNIIDKFL